MASLPPSACCGIATLHKGERQGTFEKSYINGMDSYVTGDPKSKKIIIIGMDVFGYNFKNTNLVADEFAKNGFFVLVPDLLFGEVFDPTLFQDYVKLYAWFNEHPNEKIIPKWHDFLVGVKEKAVEGAKLFSVGYCFGAGCAISELSEDGLLTAGAVAHPSRVSLDMVKKVRKPFLISAAQTDPVFTVELRHKTEAILVELNAAFQMDLFGGVEHGFAIKGDISIPVVKYAKEKCFSDILCWFNRFSK